MGKYPFFLSEECSGTFAEPFKNKKTKENKKKQNRNIYYEHGPLCVRRSVDNIRNSKNRNWVMYNVYSIQVYRKKRTLNEIHFGRPNVFGSFHPLCANRIWCIYVYPRSSDDTEHRVQKVVDIYGERHDWYNTMRILLFGIVYKHGSAEGPQV
jgi:hypothetical protein